MLYSGFNTGVTKTPIFLAGKKFEVDQFNVSEFFKDDLNKEVRDYHVMMNASPEVREKMLEYMVINDVKGFDADVSNEDVMKSIHSKYEGSTSSVLRSIDARINELRSQEV